MMSDENTREGHMNINHWEDIQAGPTYMEKVHYNVQQKYMNNSAVKMNEENYMSNDVKSVGVVKQYSMKDPVFSGPSEINQIKLSSVNQSSMSPVGEVYKSPIPNHHLNVTFIPTNEEDASKAQHILMNSDPKIQLSLGKGKRKHLDDIEDSDRRKTEAVKQTVKKVRPLNTYMIHGEKKAQKLALWMVNVSPAMLPSVKQIIVVISSVCLILFKTASLLKIIDNSINKNLTSVVAVIESSN